MPFGWAARLYHLSQASTDLISISCVTMAANPIRRAYVVTGAYLPVAKIERQVTNR